MATIKGTYESERLSGGSGNDTIYGYGGHDLLEGGAGNDVLYGGSGDDDLIGGSGANNLYGGDGADWFIFTGRSSVLSDDYIGDFEFDVDSIDVSAWGVSDFSQIKALLGSDSEGNAELNATYAGANHFITIGGVKAAQLESGDFVYSNRGGSSVSGTSRADTLFGSRGADLIQGGDGNDKLLGGIGNDRLYGDFGSDRLYGGAGSDTLTGGSGADQFVFSSASDSAPGKSRDRITDFTLDVDKINLAQIDADALDGGNQAFIWIGTDHFDAAGELRFAWSGNDTIVYGNTDDDSAAEFQIVLTGNLDLISRDFVL